MDSHGRLAVLLPRLEEAWRERDAPIVSGLRPGLSDDEIDSLMAPTGLVLPAEMRTWWRWHDGLSNFEAIGPGNWEFASLAQMVASLQYWRAGDAQVADDPDLQIWRPSWFPVVQSGPNFVLHVDTSATNEAGEAPVGYTEPYDDEPRDTVRAASFTQVVALWLDLIESGTFWLSDGFWDGDWDAVPTELKQSRLI